MKSSSAGIAALIIAFGVLLGALGAHALKNKLNAEQLTSFETGVRYQLFHGIAMIVIYLINKIRPLKSIQTIFGLMLSGTILFSFSIYLLSTRNLIGMGAELKFLGPITPIGGVLLITSWILLAVNLFRPNTNI